MKYIELHGIVVGDSLELSQRPVPLSDKQLALNLDTGEMRMGPGLWSEIKNPGTVVSIRVVAAATSNLTISTGLLPGAVVDGVTLVDGDAVLLTAQTTGSQNGIYVVGTTPARHTIMDEWAEVPQKSVYVTGGSNEVGTVWLCTSVTGGTFGSTSIVFAKTTTGSLQFAGVDQVLPIAAKTTPVDADVILIQDSVTKCIRKVTLADLKVYMA